MQDLVTSCSTWLGKRLTLGDQIFDGDEAEVWKGFVEADCVIVHVSPAWRSQQQLAWCHRVAMRAAELVPQAVPPVVVRGESFHLWRGRAVAIFPFVEGRTLDREDPGEVADAARVLGRIHVALEGWSGAWDGSGVQYAGDARLGVLDDSDLDHWWHDHISQMRVGACHGDYYRRNVLATEGLVVGVIDWHDANVGPFVAELAFAAWEFARDDNGLYVARRFEQFVDAYRSVEPPPLGHEYSWLMRCVRVKLRDNIELAVRLGENLSEPYQQRQVDAFWKLKALHD